jgi:hypothetical protein
VLDRIVQRFAHRAEEVCRTADVTG